MLDDAIKVKTSTVRFAILQWNFQEIRGKLQPEFSVMMQEKMIDEILEMRDNYKALQEEQAGIDL